MSGLLERVIEDWLTKTDERSYQLPFVALLARNGHRIKMVSRHGPGEHGKDIVSIAKDGSVCAYQLKAGDVGTPAWRSIVEEVRECASVPVGIPGMRRKVASRAFLVLTGQVSDSVREKINLINDDNREHAWPEIQLIELPDLVHQFASAFTEFFPSAISPLYDLVHLYLTDGREPLDKQRLSTILTELVAQATSPMKVKRSAANITLAVEFAITPARQQSNHVAVVEAWTMAASYILLMARREASPARYWESSIQFCRSALDEAWSSLRDECDTRSDFIEGTHVFDQAFLAPRKLMVLGFLAAGVNSRWSTGVVDCPESAWLSAVMRKVLPMPSSIWGEGAWAYQLNIALALRHSPEGVLLGELLVSNWIRAACPVKPPYLREPYWSLPEALDEMLGVEEADEFERVPVSFTAAAATGFLARRMRRTEMNELWPQVSRYDQARFIPPKPWLELSWHVEEGTTSLKVMPYTQVWANLRREAYDQRCDLFAGQEWLLPFFLCTYPHRTGEHLAGELDYMTGTAVSRDSWRAAVDRLKDLKIEVHALQI